MDVKLIAKTNTGTLKTYEFLAAIARRCYSIKPWEHIVDTITNPNAEKSKKIDAEKLMTKIIKSGHLSILEFVDYTFSIENVSVALLGQLSRHRLASFAVTSLRYNNLTKSDINVTVPKGLDIKDLNDIFYKSISDSYNAYTKLIEKGYKPEQARYVLPQGIRTNIILKMNIRELFHFFDLRNCNHADNEIHELAKKILSLCEADDKFIFSFAQHNCMDCNKFTTCNLMKDKKYVAKE